MAFVEGGYSPSWFDKLVTLGTNLASADKAFKVREDVIKSGEIDRITCDATRGDFRKLVWIARFYNPRLKREMADLPEPKLLGLQNRTEARVISGLGAVITGVGLFGRVVEAWVKKEDVSLKVERPL